MKPMSQMPLGKNGVTAAALSIFCYQKSPVYWKRYIEAEPLFQYMSPSVVRYLISSTTAQAICIFVLKGMPKEHSPVRHV